jgi:ring-1,2-phenylacetyl-CoA epoxidase subunit PaaC
MKSAVEWLHPYTEELFVMSDAASTCAQDGVLPDREQTREKWTQTISNIFDQALLEIPEVAFPQKGGRTGNHGEEMGFLLAELQYMQRAYPGMSW